MAAQALEQSALEGKDKDQLLQIAKALGVKGISKLKKADLIGAIIDTTGGDGEPGRHGRPRTEAAAVDADADASTSVHTRPSTPRGRRASVRCRADVQADTTSDEPTTVPCWVPMESRSPTGRSSWPSRASRPRRRRPPTDQSRNRSATTATGRRSGRDENGRRSTGRSAQQRPAADGQGGGESKGDGQRATVRAEPQPEQGGTATRAAPTRRQPGWRQPQPGRQPARRTTTRTAAATKRRRRRRKGGGRGQEGPQGEDRELLDDDGQPQSQRAGRSVGVPRHARRGLRLPPGQRLPRRARGRVHPRQARPSVRAAQGRPHHGQVAPRQRNEKNPAMLEIHTVNGGDPERRRSVRASKI